MHQEERGLCGEQGVLIRRARRATRASTLRRGLGAALTCWQASGASIHAGRAICRPSGSLITTLSEG